MSHQCHQSVTSYVTSLKSFHMYVVTSVTSIYVHAHMRVINTVLCRKFGKPVVTVVTGDSFRKLHLFSMSYQYQARHQSQSCHRSMEDFCHQEG